MVAWFTLPNFTLKPCAKMTNPKLIRELLITGRDIIVHNPYNPIFDGFSTAAIICINECACAIETYELDSDATRLNKGLILASIDFLQRWETWLGGVKYPSFQHNSTHTFHAMLIRFAKGAVKSWRIWRIDLQK